MLGRGRGERRADLAVQRALGPQPAGLVEEVGHLRRHPAEARAGADDDGVVVLQVGDLGDRRGLVELVVRLARDVLGHQLGHALDVDLRAGFARAFGHGLGHLFAVAVSGVIQHQDLRHDRRLGLGINHKG
ncbi:hypothetical protein D3C71_1702980 [compost metagenome]